MELFGCLVGSQFILGKTIPNPDPEKAFNFFVNFFLNHASLSVVLNDAIVIA